MGAHGLLTHFMNMDEGISFDVNTITGQITVTNMYTEENEIYENYADFVSAYEIS
jgi:uncharacterized membrane protein